MIAIIGAGYAGAATAWALARRGHGARVTLLEAEPSAGTHASGRNAGLIGALLEEDETLVEMAVRGSRLLRKPFGAGGSPAFTPCGSVRLASEGPLLDTMRRRAREAGLAVEALPTATLARDIPLLAGATAAVALRCADDGKIDPPALLASYLDAAREGGARLVTGARVTRVLQRGGRVAGVETTAGRFEADWVVDAAGAWAGAVASLAGLDDPGLVSYRRHLFFTGPVEGVEPSWPWVWDLAHDVYYRVDEDRLMLCACDADPHPPGSPAVSAAAEADLARKLALALPALNDVKRVSSRACLRTFAPDRRYVVGPDPRLAGFFWVAGLGGTGATAGAAVGDLAAEMLAGSNGARAPALARAFAPSRLLRGAGGAS